MTRERHPATKTWLFDAELDRGASNTCSFPGSLARTNLRELAARPDRFEHHLVVVARLGTAQLELATASEPLYFAHHNISDEYALPLPTGDPLLDAFPMRTFVSDIATGADVGRYNHTCGDLVLHPLGYGHWPGKLRPPYAGMAIPPGMRRCGLSLVYCANIPTPSTAPILPPPAGRDADVKAYSSPPPPISLVAVLGPSAGTDRVIARVGETELRLLDEPSEIATPHGGWLVVLATSGRTDGVAACDLIRISAGARLDLHGVARALLLTATASSGAEPDEAPSSWRALPPAPFPVLEEAAREHLPFIEGELRVDEVSAATVSVTVRASDQVATAEVPRYWLARMLFRIALHDMRLNVVETYGGFYVDDSGPEIEIGLRPSGRRIAIRIPRPQALAVIERLYRSVAPPDYRERLV